MHRPFDVSVIGGMGPLSTAELFRRVVLYTDAKCDSEHVSLCVFNDPSTPDRSGFILSKDTKERTPSPLKTIKRQIRMAKRLRCRYFCIACNTAHYFYKKYEKVRAVRFINAVRDTALYAHSVYPDKAPCILATEGTVRADIYGKNAPRDVKIRYPSADTRRAITELIKDVKSGKSIDKRNPEALIYRLRKEFNADKTVFILGCTELSLVSEFFGDLTVVDSTDVLAGCIISACKKEFNTEKFPLKTDFFE